VITIVCDTCERDLPYQRIKTFRLKLDPAARLGEPIMTGRCKKCSRRIHTDEDVNGHEVSP
jgi:hypothetical protein